VLPAFKLGADVVIAVDITAGLEDSRGYHRGVDIMVRANAIKDMKMVAYLRRLADVVIQPETQNVHWADFGAYESCIAAGIEAAQRALPGMRQVLRHERLFSVIRPGSGKRLSEQYLEARDLELLLE
jgi:NTE family protein